MERRLWRQQWRFDDKVNNRLQDVILRNQGGQILRAGKARDRRFESYVDRMTHIQKRNELFWATLYPFITLIITSGTFLILFGGRDVLNDRMTPGQLIQFIYANMLPIAPLQFVSRLPRMIMRLKTSIERINDILDRRAENRRFPRRCGHRDKGDVEFKISLSATSHTSRCLKTSICRSERGEMIGLVGSSGTGKSTMINLFDEAVRPRRGQYPD